MIENGDERSLLVRGPKGPTAEGIVGPKGAFANHNPVVCPG